MKKIAFAVFLSVFLISLVSAGQLTLDEDVVALWHFDEGEGSSVQDSTINGNDGIISGATWVTDLAAGTVLSFDGDNDFVDVIETPSRHVTGVITLDAIVKRNSDEDGTIISKNGPYFLGIRDNVIVGSIYAGSGWQEVHGTSNLEVGKWYYLKVTYDGNSVDVYVNNVLENSIAKTGEILVTSQGINLGWGEPGQNQYFNGLMDEARISKSIRTEDVDLPVIPEPEPTCENILASKPGKSKGLFKKGCSKGIMKVWNKKIGWAKE